MFAALLLDNVLRLEETVGRVTDLVMGSGRPDRELVVTLQSFDRLKQEFEALGDALTRYAEVDECSADGRRGARATRTRRDRCDYAWRISRIVCCVVCRMICPTIVAPPISPQAGQRRTGCRRGF